MTTDIQVDIIMAGLTVLLAVVAFWCLSVPPRRDEP
jgi:hypothetical protein